ncbi:hypothetical protein FOCC_FOCC012456, partial [Frankliniella occidentalis]
MTSLLLMTMWTQHQALLNLSIAGFVSKLYSLPHVNRALVKIILNSISGFLMNGHLELLQTCVELIFNNVEGPEQEKTTVRQMFSVMKNPFSHLETEHQRFAVLSDTCPSLNPSPYFIGQLDNEIVCCKEILGHMDYLNNQNDVVSNIIQGTVRRECSQNFGDKLVLPLNLCYDDFVPDDTLMAHGGDTELGPLYCRIPILPGKYLRALENIFVTSLFLTKNRKLFGNAAVFRPVIDELEFLYNEGIEVVTENGSFRIYFCLCCIIGDSKGVNEICGFSKRHKTMLQFEIVSNAELRTPGNYAVDVVANDFHTTGVHEEC